VQCRGRGQAGWCVQEREEVAVGGAGVCAACCLAKRGVGSVVGKGGAGVLWPAESCVMELANVVAQRGSSEEIIMPL